MVKNVLVINTEGSTCLYLKKEKKGFIFFIMAKYYRQGYTSNLITIVNTNPGGKSLGYKAYKLQWDYFDFERKKTCSYKF